MKTKLIAIASTIAFTAVSNGAISLSGTALKNVPGSTGVDLPAGRLGLMIVDTAGDGFLNGTIQGAVAANPINPLSIPGLNTNQGGLTVGSTFFGDTVVGRLTTTAALGGDMVISGALASFDAASVLSKSYAIVWFDTLTTAGLETVAENAMFGIARGGDWTMPVANSGTFSFGTTASSLDQITLATAGAATAASGQSVAFATNGTSLVAGVPEPSAALLGALGALGLLRRRRI